MLAFYLKMLSAGYFAATLLHGLDLLDFRGHFSQMPLIQQMWTVYLTLADAIVVIALWKATRLGELLFLLITISQLAVYLGWSEYFGNQYAWVGFHFVALSIYLVLLSLKVRAESHQIEA